MMVYITASVENAARAEHLEGELRKAGHEVRRHAFSPMTPKAAQDRADAINECSAMVVFLPCGDAQHVDLGYAIGLRDVKYIVLVGSPKSKSQSTACQWVDGEDCFLAFDAEVPQWLAAREVRDAVMSDCGADIQPETVEGALRADAPDGAAPTVEQVDALVMGGEDGVPPAALEARWPRLCALLDEELA